MKKFFSMVLAVIISLGFTGLQAIAEGSINFNVNSYNNSANEYDFSEEAQEQFNRKQQEFVNRQYVEFHNPAFKVKKRKGSNNSQSSNPVINNNPPLYNQPSVNKPYNYEQAGNKTLYGAVTYIPAGEEIEVILQSTLSSGSLEENDKILANLKTDWTYNGKVIAPAGSFVYGTATSAKGATYAFGSGSMEITFNQILPPEGSPIYISTEKIYYGIDSERAVNMSKSVLIGTGLGLVSGLLATVFTGFDNIGENMMMYGGMGAVYGGVTGVFQRGRDVTINEGTVFHLKLSKPVSVMGTDR